MGTTFLTRTKGCWDHRDDRPDFHPANRPGTQAVGPVTDFPVLEWGFPHTILDRFAWSSYMRRNVLRDNPPDPPDRPQRLLDRSISPGPCRPEPEWVRTGKVLNREGPTGRSQARAADESGGLYHGG
ncbi:hypothetical protein GCM10007856_43310 [Azospirillum oryzae]|nr:hypothetical protein GCM10007856_43310 [Azospirillum oryzae]